MPKTRMIVVASLAAAVAVGVLLAHDGLVGDIAAEDRTETIASALQQRGAPEVASAYNAFRASEAGRDVRLAQWRAGHTKYNYHTGIAVSNVGDEPADVRISFEGSDGNPVEGCGRPCSATVPAGGSHYWWPGELPGMPTDPQTVWGTAVITGTQPIVAVVHDLSITQDPTALMDASAYRGATTAVINDTGRFDTHVPLILHSPGRMSAAASASGALLDDGTDGISGAGQTSLRVLNRDLLSSAQLAGQFYAQGGGGGPHEWPGQAEPGQWHDLLYRPDDPLPAGAFAAVVASDRPIAALSRTDWSSSGGAMTVENSDPGTSVIAPLALKNHEGGCSLVTVQNTDTAASATINVVFRAVDGAILLLRQYAIMPGASITLRPCDEDDFIANLPVVFDGWAHITSGDADQRLAVQVTIDYARSRMAVAGFQGVPAESAAESLYAPAVHAAWPAGGFGPLSPLVGIGVRLSSSVAVVNPHEEDVVLIASYAGLRGDCRGQEFAQGPVTVPAMGQVVLEPALDGTLPVGCLAAARIETSGTGVVAVVLDKGALPISPTPVPTTPVPTVDTGTPNAGTSTSTPGQGTPQTTVTHPPTASTPGQTPATTPLTTRTTVPLPTRSPAPGPNPPALIPFAER